MTIHGFDSIEPGNNLEVELTHIDGTTNSFEVAHSYSNNQLEWLRAGSALNQIRDMVAVG